jgi:GNAT superfamily N-acetyltransferase
MTQTTISVLAQDTLPANLEHLAALLHACVHDGASIGFILPFTPSASAAFWQENVFPAVANGRRLLLAAWVDGTLAGSVQLDYGTPANQPHRAEVRKLLVHPDYRRRGIAQGLMKQLERQAASLGRTLLTLDTRSGDHAEPLYAALGYSTAGVIPDYCLAADDITRLDSTTIMYKAL